MSRQPDIAHHNISVPSDAGRIECFEALLRLAGWNERKNCAWFVPDEDGKLSPGIIVQRVAQVELQGAKEPFVPNTGTEPPQWLDAYTSKPMEVYYNRWTLGSLALPEALERVVEPSRYRPNYKPKDELDPKNIEQRPTRNAIAPSICYYFGREATSMDELAYYTQRFVEWLQMQPLNRGKELTTLPDALFGQSLSLATANGTYGTPETNAFLALVHTLEPQHRAYSFIQTRIGSCMTRLLRGDALDTHPEIRSRTHRPIIFEALGRMDEQGMLTSDFWLGAGMAQGIAVRSADMRSLLLAKLLGELNQPLEKGKSDASLEFIAQMYVANLLEYLAQDERRDTQKLASIIKFVRPDTRGPVQRAQFVELANVIGQGWNRTVPSGQPPYGKLDRFSPHDIAPALLRILNATYAPNLPAAAKSEAIQEDLEHLDVLRAFLDTTPFQRKRLGLADMRLLFPKLGGEPLHTLYLAMQSCPSLKDLREIARREGITLR